MLKRLELVGFKSFADRTVFEFGDGITAIVGPNGSGKSNIVDAVRWILGEQSAKSLRGGEMADVIFNGSTTRRSLGLAEVTLTFDNARRQLITDAEEVEITRRVYRSGEGEYLINGQVCRLRDIKEMFLGSGAGNDAYCIIAQGRVDALLQASTKDRRTIFEEAAGISRFKAKKIEALRKLEHALQNLERVKDIIEEVEKQLRSVKLQASKAQRFQETSNRLKELRLAVGLDEYAELTQKLESELNRLEQLRGELDQRAARAGACEAGAERLEIFLADLDDQLREHEAHLARVLQQIQSEETTIAYEDSLSADLEVERGRTRKRVMDLVGSVSVLAQTTRKAEEELAHVEKSAAQEQASVQEREQRLQATLARLQELSQQLSGDKTAHLEAMRRSAHSHNEAVSSKAQLDNLRRERDRLRLRSEQAAAGLASIDLELDTLLGAETQLGGKLQETRSRLHEKRQEQERFQALRARAAERISELREQRSGLASRIEVLEGLIKSHEGLGTGVREVIALTEAPEPGAWGAVLGMIADFLTVKREYAPLIDIALGDWAQRFIVRDVHQLEVALAQHTQPFAGRVSFLPLVPAAPSEAGGDRAQQLSLLSPMDGGAPVPRHTGLIAPAEQLVSCDHSELADLPAQLLGRTLIVRDLAAARALAEQTNGYRFVTLQGELLESDGTLTIGTHHAEAGMLTRKSELRELGEDIVHLDERLRETEHDFADLRDRISVIESALQALQPEIDVLGEQAADLRNRVQRHRDRREGLHEEVAVSRDEMQKIDQEIAALEAAWEGAQAEAAAADARVKELHARMHEADEELRRRDHEREAQQRAGTEARVALAQVEERLRGLQTQFQQTSRECQQRLQELAQGRQALGDCQRKLTESQRAILQASAVLAQAYLDKERSQRQVAEMVSQREQKRLERGRLSQQAQSVRTEWRKHQENVHQRDLEATSLRHQRETLAQRLMDDYQVDLAQRYRERQTTGAAEVAVDPAAVNSEIEELRKKLSRLGSVNLDSLQELSELEARAASLQTQFDDLASARRSLEEIIGKINQDSRKLFVDTFTDIRSHFQELFRKLFGGGMADVVLEDETDVLESGIEIIARPPGKELRSISLMSGGEKTMTAVALLLAIFRSKPSPFCVLDEVDAALDEANIGRFTAVLREFLSTSHFIVVTHSKKTMAAADVLYGITMQESGISKQVAIRFEDWVDETENPADEPEKGVA